MVLSVEQIKQRAQPWLEPINAQAPTGLSARNEPAYEAVLAEISKLDSLSGGTVDWAGLVDKSSTLLKTRSKDLLLACYLAAGLQAKDDLEGLVTGLGAVAELMDLYWPTLFPEVARLRARVNALAWLISRAATLLGNVKAPKAETVASLSVAAARLAEVTRAKFEDKGPAMGPLLDAIKRLELSVSAPPPVASAPVAAAPRAAQPAAPAADGLSADAIPEFLRQVGQSLCTAAAELYRTNGQNPLAYRLSRTGLWLHVVDAPPKGAAGNTSVPPLAPNTRAQLERLAANGKWQELLDEAESAVRQFRFCLDLQQLSARALGGLGKTHEAARNTLLTEVASLVRRLPALVELTNADGSPFASPQTREWLAEEVQGKPLAKPDAPAAGGEGAPPEAIAQARAMLKQGQAAEAIALLQSRLTAAGTSREKFVLRLAQAKLCAEGGQLAVAKGLYAALDQEGLARGLDAWEPRLAIECLEGLLTSARILSKALPADLMGQYHRLCQLDPALAQRIGSDRA